MNDDATLLARLATLREMLERVEALIQAQEGSGLAADMWWIRNLRAVLAGDRSALDAALTAERERIAQEADRRAHNEDLYSQGPESEPGDHDYFRGRHDALIDLASFAREDPRYADPATDGALDARGEDE